MELAAGQSFNSKQLLKCLHQPDYYLPRVFQKLIKDQWNGGKVWHVYVSVGYNVWNCRNEGKNCVILTGILSRWGKAGKPLPSWSSAAHQAASLGAPGREVVTPFSKALLTLTAEVPAKERTKNCSVEVLDNCFMWYSESTNPKSSYRHHPDPWVKAIWMNEK